MTNEQIAERLNAVSQILCLELGLDAIQILAIDQRQDETFITYEAGSGLYPARVQLAREFVLAKDTIAKREAWDSAGSNNEINEV